MKTFLLAAALLLSTALVSLAGDDDFAPIPPIPDGDEAIVLGTGCFWCSQAIFEQFPGIVSTTVGYMGGTVRNPTYEDVSTGETGHAEVCRVVYDPKKTTLDKILDMYWHSHDPTSLNKQGADRGTQYRSVIFYYTDAQKEIAEKSKTDVAKEYSKPIVTEITKAGEFYAAENYHQHYYQNVKDHNPYNTMVIAPKLKKLGLKQ